MTDNRADSDRQPRNGVVVADEMADADGQEQAGEWVSPSVAAARLTISQRTLDRRIAAGKLRRRLRPNGSTQVWLPLSASAEVADRSADKMAANDSHERAERSLALVERVNLAVTQQIQPLVELVERQQRTIAEQAELIGELKTRLAAAEPSKEEPVAVEPIAAVEATPAPAMRPWWRFWS